MADSDSADSVADRLLKEAEQFERAARRARIVDRAKLEAISERLLELACEVQQSDDPRTGRAGKRFGFPEVQKLIETRDCVACPLSTEEAAKLTELQEEDSNHDGENDTQCDFSDEWKWDGTRQTVIQHSSASTEARELFDQDRHETRGHSRALRRLLQCRPSMHIQHRRSLKRGQIDPRHIARGLFDDRVFRLPVWERQNGLAICLLIDESGSMFSGTIGTGTPSKFDAARQVAALFFDAFHACPDIELEIYTHTSCGEDERDCLIRYCYGRRHQDVASIADSVGGNNYDH